MPVYIWIFHRTTILILERGEAETIAGQEEEQEAGTETAVATTSETIEMTAEVGSDTAMETDIPILLRTLAPVILLISTTEEAAGATLTHPLATTPRPAPATTTEAMADTGKQSVAKSYVSVIRFVRI